MHDKHVASKLTHEFHCRSCHMTNFSEYYSYYDDITTFVNFFLLLFV